MRKLSVFLGLVWLLAACSGAGTETAVSKAEQITCTVAYRSSVSVGIEREETLTFGDVDAEQTAVFDEMTFHAALDAGGADNERNLRLWITDTGETVLHAILYQFEMDSGPQNQFVGGHGFTGLNYSYAPNATAELQFWCEAK